jgi:hypothetical protein
MYNVMSFFLLVLVKVLQTCSIDGDPLVVFYYLHVVMISYVALLPKRLKSRFCLLRDVSLMFRDIDPVMSRALELHFHL